MLEDVSCGQSPASKKLAAFVQGSVDMCNSLLFAVHLNWLHFRTGSKHQRTAFGDTGSPDIIHPAAHNLLGRVLADLHILQTTNLHQGIPVQRLLASHDLKCILLDWSDSQFQ